MPCAQLPLRRFWIRGFLGVWSPSTAAPGNDERFTAAVRCGAFKNRVMLCSSLVDMVVAYPTWERGDFAMARRLAAGVCPGNLKWDAQYSN